MGNWNFKEEPYIKIPIWFIRQSKGKLTPLEIMIYSHLKGLSQNKPSYASDTYLAKMFGKTREHVNRSLRKLERYGYIKRLEGQGRRLIDVVETKGSMFVERKEDGEWYYKETKLSEIEEQSKWKELYLQEYPESTSER